MPNNIEIVIKGNSTGAVNSLKDVSQGLGEMDPAVEKLNGLLDNLGNSILGVAFKSLTAAKDQQNNTLLHPITS